MSDSADYTQDDSSIKTDGLSKEMSPKPFRRIASEQTFRHLQQMERNYSKLGDGGYKQKDLNANGRIKVASVNSLHKVGKLDLNPEPVFAGRRDVTDPGTIKERQIVSRRGSVRGFKNRVRAGIATFLENQNGITATLLEISDHLEKKNAFPNALV